MEGAFEQGCKPDPEMGEAGPHSGLPEANPGYTGSSRIATNNAPLPIQGTQESHYTLSLSSKDSKPPHGSSSVSLDRKRQLCPCSDRTGESDESAPPGYFNTTSSHRSLFAISILLFVALTTSGIIAVDTFVEQRVTEVEAEASGLAINSVSFFADQLDKATLPLLTMAQLALELDVFQVLPSHIGQADAPGSLPFINETRRSFRNISGVCDEEALLDRYASIADTAKKNAKMDGVLANIQLAPDGVICLIHPLVNTEDFPDGTELDSRPAVGLDLLNDAFMSSTGREGIVGDKPSFAGPLKLLQCPSCDPFLIVRLPIVDPTQEIEVDGESYPRWGFATILINWNALVSLSGIHENFAQRSFEFCVTRTDVMKTGESRVVVLTESDGFDQVSSKREIVEVISTSNGDWTIRVRTGDTHKIKWQGWVSATVVVVSLLISILVHVVLIQKQIQNSMKSRTMANAAQVEVERKISAYFAHELRNPLSAIDCALEAFPEDIPSENRDLIESMQLCSKFMSSIMNNLLDARKMEEGKMTLQQSPLSIRKLLDSVHRMIEPSVNAEVKFLRKCYTGDHDWVLGDAHRLQQILTNIVTNSVKYTSTGSITMIASWQSNVLRLECRDTGPGIPKEEQSVIFDRFEMRGGASGSGLGLSIAKQLVDLMNGSIRFESDPSTKPGTSCIIDLPLETCAQPVAKPEGDSTLIQDHLRILCIDDIRMNRVMLKKRIEKTIAPNCIFTEASTGEEAMDVCGDAEFDVIVVDQFMDQAGGKLLGTEAVEVMRARGIKSVIIGCSGNDLDSEFFRAGADFVWKKPLPSNSEIISQLRSAVPLLATKKNI